MWNLVNEFMFWCWWYVCTCELDDQLLLILNSCVKNLVCEYVVFLWKMMNNEVVVWWIWNEFHGWLLLVMFENMLLMNWYDDYAHWWFGDESCCWWWIIMKVLVNFWIGTKWCLIQEFWPFLCMCLCTWPINIIWDEFWVWEDQNWSVWEKGFWNSKFLFWTEECSLKRRLSEPQASVPSSILDIVRLSEPWAKGKRTTMLLLSRVRLSEWQANLKRTRPERYWDLVA